MKIVIRDLPMSSPKSTIAASIEAAGFRVIATHQLTRFRTKKLHPLFYLQIQPVDKLQEIYDIKNIMGTEIRIEPYQGRKGCYNATAAKDFFTPRQFAHFP